MLGASEIVPLIEVPLEVSAAQATMLISEMRNRPNVKFLMIDFLNYNYDSRMSDNA
jgi:hypothetical protein